MTETSRPDPMMVRIGEGIELSQRGEREAARCVFTDLWDEIGPSGDPLHRCTVAHWMADLQDDVSKELIWDLRALEAAESVSEECARNAGVIGGARAMLPSLHLNLGDGFRKLGQPNKARAHLELGRAAAPALSDDGYGRMIRGGLDRLEERLSGG